MDRLHPSRLLATIPVMVVVAIFVFPVAARSGRSRGDIAGEDATAAQIAAVRTQLGLDRRFFEQLWSGSAECCRGTSALDFLEPAGQPAHRAAH